MYKVREEEIREQQLRDLAAKAWTLSSCLDSCSPTLLCQARQQRAELASASVTQISHRIEIENSDEKMCEHPGRLRTGRTPKKLRKGDSAWRHAAFMEN